MGTVILIILALGIVIAYLSSRVRKDKNEKPENPPNQGEVCNTPLNVKATLND